MYQTGSYAIILTTGACGAIVGALFAGKFPNSISSLLFALLMTGFGVALMGLPVPLFIIYAGHFIYEGFMSIFNIHFFTQVQTRVEEAYLRRVLSAIYTLDVLFMPLATGIMTVLPSIHIWSFEVIGLGIVVLAGLGIVLT